MEDMKPRRLRIVEPGLANYTGPIGGEEFVDGVSMHPVSWREANRIGAAMQVEDYDEPGYRVSPAEQMFRIRTTPADDSQVNAVGRAIMVDGEIKEAATLYTRKDLEEIADKRGLAGLREVAAQWNVSARAINDMITRILEAQLEGAKPASKPTEEKPAEPSSETSPANEATP